MAGKVRCVRCESLERKQKSRKIVYSGPDGSIPLCSVCIQEIAEMDLFFKIQQEEDEEYEPGSEIFDS
jgi:hypothetical protein